MLTAILSFLGIVPAALNTIDGIEKAISNEKLAQISATTDQERIASQERVASLQVRRDILVKEAATPSGIWNTRMRTFAAIGPVTILLKLFFWDKVVGSLFGCAGPTHSQMPTWPFSSCNTFNTDPLDPHQWYVITAVIVFYFAADAYAGKK